MSNYVCLFHQNSLLSWTLYFGATDYDMVRATAFLVASSDWFAIVAMSMSICLNTALCVDLILMVRYPFNNKESRIYLYLGVSLLISIITGIFAVFVAYNLVLLWVGALIQIIVTSLFVISFIGSICYTYSKLRGPGMSKQVRNLVLNRHVATMLIYLICNTYIFCTYFAIVFPSLR